MRRVYRVVAVFFALLAVWTGAFLGFTDEVIQRVCDATLKTPGCLEQVRNVIGALPVYTLIALGCYALYSVGIALFTFSDCDQAAKDLQVDIKEAKAILRKKGYTKLEK